VREECVGSGQKAKKEISMRRMCGKLTEGEEGNKYEKNVWEVNRRQRGK
jgi:hypothetical protein